jgi:hypothetical protein
MARPRGGAVVSPVAVTTGTCPPGAADGNAAGDAPTSEGRTATVDGIDATSAQTSSVPMTSATHPPTTVRAAGLVRADEPTSRGGVGELTRRLEGGGPTSDGRTPSTLGGFGNGWSTFRHHSHDPDHSRRGGGCRPGSHAPPGPHGRCGRSRTGGGRGGAFPGPGPWQRNPHHDRSGSAQTRTGGQRAQFPYRRPVPLIERHGKQHGPRRLDDHVTALTGRQGVKDLGGPPGSGVDATVDHAALSLTQVDLGHVLTMSLHRRSCGSPAMLDGAVFGLPLARSQ